MDLKQAIRQYHYGEQIKTLLINAGNLLSELDSLEESQRDVGVKFYKSVLEQVRGEVQAARYLADAPSLHQVDSKLRDAIWESHIRRPDEVARILGEAISLTVSATLDAARHLKEKELL